MTNPSIASDLIERSRKLLEGITPGPWRSGIWMGDANRKHVVDMGQPGEPTTFAMLTDRNSMFPASAIVHSDGDLCEIEANAKLIAAAPAIIAEQAEALSQLTREVDERDELLREARKVIAAMPISEMVGRIVGEDKVRTYEEARGLFVRNLANIDEALSRSSGGMSDAE